MSAYFQNGAGELVGMCWLGRWAVLGGASLGCTRCGAGVTNAPSSCMYDEVNVGDPSGAESESAGAVSVKLSELVAIGFTIRGSGLPSAMPPDSSGSGLRMGRTGVE
jgi:hypothetical protein